MLFKTLPHNLYFLILVLINLYLMQLGLHLPLGFYICLLVLLFLIYFLLHEKYIFSNVIFMYFICITYIWHIIILLVVVAEVTLCNSNYQHLVKIDASLILIYKFCSNIVPLLSHPCNIIIISCIYVRYSIIQCYNYWFTWS